jgi:hypothetical protein
MLEALLKSATTGREVRIGEISTTSAPELQPGTLDAWCCRWLGAEQAMLATLGTASGEAIVHVSWLP